MEDSPISFRLRHVGINAPDSAAAEDAAQRFCQAFGLPCRPGRSSVFAGDGIEVMRGPYLGRCGHIANASYAVDSACRGRHIGEKLVSDCPIQAKRFGCRHLQFNAVVENNIHARHLYERLGFVQVGTIPGGFRMKDGTYQNICLYYHTL